MTQDIRWKQRFQNYERALKKLRSAILKQEEFPQDELYQMGLIQAFEFTFELGWKCLKDYLEEEGLGGVATPKKTIKEAYKNQIIEDGQCWIDMNESRNLISHAYDESRAEASVRLIAEKFIIGLEQIYEFLLNATTEEDL